MDSTDRRQIEARSRQLLTHPRNVGRILPSPSFTRRALARVYHRQHGYQEHPQPEALAG